VRSAGLLNDVIAAEDIVQDVFLMLVHSADKDEIRKSLNYLGIFCETTRRGGQRIVAISMRF
jgi:hypothetical protein